MQNTRYLPALAALNGLLAVAIGAFGAHGITDPQAKDWIETATLFQLPHAAAILGLVAWRPHSKLATLAALALGIGALMFAGSLQLLALGAPRGLAAAAPLGGSLLMVGWIAILFCALGNKKGRG